MFWATDQPKDDTKPCNVCAEPIKKTARICNHCKSYQDWRAALNFSQSILALLIALISVSTVFIPILKDSLTAKETRLIFSLHVSQPGRLTLLVSNNGNLPGSLQGADLVLLDNSNPISPSIKILPLSIGHTLWLTPSAKLISPGTSELIEFFTDSNLVKYKSIESGGLRISVTNFDGSKPATEVKMDSRELGVFLGRIPPFLEN